MTGNLPRLVIIPTSARHVVPCACTAGSNAGLDASRFWSVRDAGLFIKSKGEIMAKKNVLVLLAAFAISIPAFAADTGGYLVGMIGQTKFKDVDTTGIANASVKDTDT